MDYAKTTADLTHDEIVELAVRSGFLSEDATMNKLFFEAVHHIVWRALSQELHNQRRACIRQLAVELANERARWMRRLEKVSMS